MLELSVQYFRSVVGRAIICLREVSSPRSVAVLQQLAYGDIT